MKIFLFMIPPTVTAQERKVKIVRGRPFFYKPENVKVAQAEIIRHLRPFKPQEPMEGAIELKDVLRLTVMIIPLCALKPRECSLRLNTEHNAPPSHRD